MIPYEYDSMIQAYESSSNLPEQIDLVLEKFDDDRISGLVEKWWSSPVFADKKELIEAGIAAYQMGTSGGYILCIKTLISEIEGLMRTVYFEDTGKGNHVKSPSLVQHVTEKGAENAGTSQSLLLPEQFRDYLDSIVFANFNVETGEVDLSRNTVGHGVADAEQYTKSRALQMILILDQLYFYN